MELGMNMFYQSELNRVVISRVKSHDFMTMVSDLNYQRSWLSSSVRFQASFSFNRCGNPGIQSSDP